MFIELNLVLIFLNYQLNSTLFYVKFKYIYLIS
jgi:hypothetical protein